MKKAINRFKLTPQIYKELEVLSRKIPECFRKDKFGKVMSRQLTKVIKGADIPEKNRPEKWSSHKLYTQTYREPLIVNHFINLLDVYKKDGMNGVNDYIKFFDKVVSENKLKEKEINGDN